MESHFIQVDYDPTASHLIGNHSHIIITCSRLATASIHHLDDINWHQACAQMPAGAFKCKCNLDESNASANANAQQLNQMQVQMQMRSS